MSVRFSVEAFKKLDRFDFKILNAIERGMSAYMYVPVEVISSFSRLDVDFVMRRLKKLNTLGVVSRRLGAHTGYILTSRGYDCLAFNALVKRGTLESISATPIGMGKEADVYIGITPAGKKVAVKFHRAGRTSFRGIRVKRAYVGERSHVSWLYLSRLAAKNEYQALQILSREKVSVPKPIDWTRHIVVTEFIEAVELSRTPKLNHPDTVLEKIIQNIKKAYRVGVVHGDLSEYNILVRENDEPVIFDWPQWVPSNHPSALILLRRDFKNILKFFKRKYGLNIKVEACLEKLVSEIAGEREST